jgi:hypothetical protein
MSQKSKPCKVRVYVFTHLAPFYNLSPELKPSFYFLNLPTLSQAFQEFMDYNALDSLRDKEFDKIPKGYPKKAFSLKVKCATAKLWEGLSPDQKEHLTFWFNRVLAFRLEKLFGGVWI